MSQFKPGDLALVINSGDEACIGRIVEILEVLIDTKKRIQSVRILPTEGSQMDLPQPSWISAVMTSGSLRRKT